MKPCSPENVVELLKDNATVSEGIKVLMNNLSGPTIEMFTPAQGWPCMLELLPYLKQGCPMDLLVQIQNLIVSVEQVYHTGLDRRMLKQMKQKLYYLINGPLKRESVKAPSAGASGGKKAFSRPSHSSPVNASSSYEYPSYRSEHKPRNRDIRVEQQQGEGEQQGEHQEQQQQQASQPRQPRQPRVDTRKKEGFRGRKDEPRRGGGGGQGKARAERQKKLFSEQEGVVMRSLGWIEDRVEGAPITAKDGATVRFGRSKWDRPLKSGMPVVIWKTAPKCGMSYGVLEKPVEGKFCFWGGEGHLPNHGGGMLVSVRYGSRRKVVPLALVGELVDSFPSNLVAQRNSDSAMRIGDRLGISDIARIQMGPQIAFEVGELVAVPRSDGGWTLGKTLEKVRIPCPSGGEGTKGVSAWRVITEDSDETRNRRVKLVGPGLLGKFGVVGQDDHDDDADGHEKTSNRRNQRRQHRLDHDDDDDDDNHVEEERLVHGTMAMLLLDEEEEAYGARRGDDTEEPMWAIGRGGDADEMMIPGDDCVNHDNDDIIDDMDEGANSDDNLDVASQWPTIIPAEPLFPH